LRKQRHQREQVPGAERQGKGPREIELDGRIIITPEAESDWRREREAETAEKRAIKAAVE
jgi:hypothetical protein